MTTSTSEAQTEVRKSQISRPLFFALIILLLILAAIIFAFAAANVVPESGAGDGSNTISGYTITNITYTLDATDPSEVDVVAMDVGPTAGAAAATDVRVTIDGGTNWITCAGPSGTTWTCTFASGVTVVSLSLLQVVAVQ